MEASWLTSQFLVKLLCMCWVTFAHGDIVLVEMSHPYNNVTASPPDPAMWKYSHENVHRGPWQDHGDIWFEINNYRMNEHAGTHVDAPVHFNRDGWDPSQIPLERLYRIPAIVVNITQKARVDPHAQLEPEDLISWEAAHGKIPENSAILVDSGWSSKYGTPEFMAIVRDENNTIIDMRFPSISPAAAQWLVDNRPRISCVGIDTTSIEYEPGYNYTTHRILLGQNIYAIENLANPDLLPASGAMVTILPIRLEDGSGAAARIVGEYTTGEQLEEPCNGAPAGNRGLALLSLLYIVMSLLL